MLCGGAKLQVSEIVLDSSVLIAVLKDEHYEKDVLHLLEGALLSTVNMAEVWSKLEEDGLASSVHVASLFALLGAAVPFTERHARLAARLRNSTRSAGLSLGDLACLALAIEMNADVYTADRAWKDLNLPCRVHLIR